jgi:rhodanese-related sulfurtransferase
MATAVRCVHLCWLAILCVGFGVLQAAAPDSGADLPSIDSVALARLIDDQRPVVIIDVTGTKAFRAGHIPGAIDFQAQKKRIDQLLQNVDRDVPVIAYCGTEHCPAWHYGATAARELGLSDVRRLRGGFLDWQAQRPDQVASTH